MDGASQIIQPAASYSSERVCVLGEQPGESPTGGIGAILWYALEVLDFLMAR